MESLIQIIKRKNRQGRYVMQDEDFDMFDNIDKQVRFLAAGGPLCLQGLSIVPTQTMYELKWMNSVFDVRLAPETKLNTRAC